MDHRAPSPMLVAARLLPFSGETLRALRAETIAALGIVPTPQSPTLSRNKKQLQLRRIHHSPLFWVGAVLFLAAIAIYVFSDDLSWRPSAR